MDTTYSVDEEVLVEYNGFYYLAKVLQIRDENDTQVYHVKYNRFSTQYNENVSKSRLKKATPETVDAEENRKREYIQKQKLLKRAGNSTKNISNTTLSSPPHTGSSSSSPHVQGGEFTVESAKPVESSKSGEGGDSKRTRSTESMDQSWKRYRLQ
uniref:Chromatin modification-related protein eaf3 n=1 Tax=Lygus hesperus TaxID=30085 RepID=A0A0A9VUB1_LYGHE